MLSQQTLETKLENLTYPRVTRELIESRIAKVSFFVLPETTTTICNMTLDNGYSVRGESACVDKRNFNMAIGEKLAHDDAFRKMWALFGFMLAENTHNAALRKAGTPA
jgi:hypothetical protein